MYLLPLLLLLFTLPATAQQIRLVEPNGGERYHTGDSITFRWDGVSADTPVWIEYSTDGGIHWQEVADSVTGGSFRWMVPSTLGERMMARIWSASGWESIAVMRQDAGVVEARYIAGDRILSLDMDSAATIWKGDGSGMIHRLKTPANEFPRGSVLPRWSVSPSADGSTVAHTYNNDTVTRVWDVATGRLLHTLPGSTFGLISRGIVPDRFHPDSRRLTSSRYSHPVKEWDSSGALVREIPLPERIGPIAHDVWYTPDGTKMIVFASAASQFATHFDVRDAESGRLLYTRTTTSGVTDGEIIMGGEVLFLAAYDGGFSMFELATGTRIRFFDIHFTPTYARISPDGSLIATARGNGIFSVSTGKQVTGWEWFNGSPNIHDFTRDSRGLLIGHLDGTISITDVRTGRVVDSLKGHTEAVYSIHFSTDGSRMLTASADSTLRIWRVGITRMPVDSSDANWSIVVPASVPAVDGSAGSSMQEAISAVALQVSRSFLDATFTVAQTGMLRLSIVDVAGQVLYSAEEHLTPGTIRRSIDCRGLPQGAFFLVAAINGRHVVQPIAR